ncbi:MAG: S49 family peptidase, partial [candidate division Zixibacteria bacterium]|nr:S49 family peptidase [candidate division Zixibacteria bacterium]
MMILRTWMFAAISIMAMGLVGAAQGGEVTLPEEVFFFQPVASVEGQASVWINPAAVPAAQGGTLVLFTQRNGRLIRDYGMATNWRTFGAAWRHIAGNDRPDLNEYIFAVGGGQRNRLGLSYRYFKDGPGYLNHRHLWTVGFLARANAKFALGARAENINRSRIDGVKSDVRFVYGAAYRLYQNIVTVSFDVDMTNKESFNRADFRTGVEVRPKPGLYLYGDITNHSRIQLGFRMNFGSSYAGHYHYFDRNIRSLSGTSYIGTVKGAQPSLTNLKRKTLVVSLDGELPENPKIPVFGVRPLRFFDYLDGIYRAADDDTVERMFLHIGTLNCGLGKAEELAEAIASFRDHHKPVAAFLDDPDNISYFVAAGADSIFVSPVSELRLVGLRAELTSYKGLLDKLGVEAEVERVGDYKTAPEGFILDRPSEANREQINRLLDGLYGDLTASIAERRALPVDSVKALIDAAPLTSVDACRAGLVDRRCYFREALDDFADSGPYTFSREIGLAEYRSQRVTPDSWASPPKLAVIVADGDIGSGESGGRVGEDELLGEIDRVRRDREVAAVVLRVNSPGGAVIASDLLRHEIELLAQEKPLVISMGNVAASGGYYISAVGCPILVDRNTITGSIGIFAGKANLASLYDKLNIHSE